jgi:antitoxin component YwqK of YwqJK toxin-antitoxin module
MNQGKWTYYFEDGKQEGECVFDKGKGTYYGYYPNGTLQTKGQIDNGLRVGTWELYEQDGVLSGYYKPFYEDKTLANQINSLLNRPSYRGPTISRTARKGFYYFTPRFPEYRGVIMSGNPLSTFIGTMPFGIEFYNEERLGHEFEFEAIRNPFYAADSKVVQDQLFKRGYAIGVKQKFYNPWKAGMWYFSHEVRFTNVGHFANVTPSISPTTQITASAFEQKAEYGVMLGTRLMQHNNADGFTIDAFVGYGLGYRGFDVEPLYEDVFAGLNQKKISNTFRFGLSFGYSFSFDVR